MVDRNSKRSFKRTSDKGLVEINGDDRPDIIQARIYNPNTRLRDSIIEQESIEVADTNFDEMMADDREVISFYLQIPLSETKSNKIITPEKVIGLNIKLSDYPFWSELDDNKRSELRTLYLEYYVETIKYDAYNTLEVAIEDDDQFLEQVRKRKKKSIVNQEKLSNKIGSIVSDELDDLGDDTVIPRQYSDVVDYSSSVHSDVLIFLSYESRGLANE